MQRTIRYIYLSSSIFQQLVIISTNKKNVCKFLERTKYFFFGEARERDWKTDSESETKHIHKGRKKFMTTNAGIFRTVVIRASQASSCDHKKQKIVPCGPRYTTRATRRMHNYGQKKVPERNNALSGTTRHLSGTEKRSKNF